MNKDRVKKMETQLKAQSAMTWKELVTGAKQPDPQTWADFLRASDASQKEQTTEKDKTK